MKITTYGPGGFDPQKPANNVTSDVQVADDPRVVNAATLRAKATQALTANASFLALAAPTNAQNAAQVAVVTRECSAVIRLLLGLLDDTTGT